MKCDLHVHTIHSGMCTVPVLNRVCRESYNDPHEVYETLKRRGMQLVTVTDHDSIDAVERLRRHPDFFLSEEVSCSASSGTRLHIGVYDIEERDHIELQRRAPDFPSLLAYMYERRLLFSINHAFSGLTGSRVSADFEEFVERFPLVETLNGQMRLTANRYADQMARIAAKPAAGGSDAHTLECLGRTYTEVRGARDAREFLEGLRRGDGVVAGESGDYWKLTRAITSIGLSMMREHPLTLALLPLVALVPLITFANLVRETWFAHAWGRKIDRSFALPQEAFLRCGSSSASS